MRSDPLPPASPADASVPQLDLCFARGPRGNVYLSRQRAGYPFHVGRLLDAPAGARVIVQSTSGGLFEHDEVAQHVVATYGATARVETAAATIVHSMTHGMARARVRIEALPGARLDWLPQPSILFPGARLVSHIDAVLHPGARMLLMDSYMSHDPSGGQQPFGALDASIDVRSPAGRLLARDSFRLAGGGAAAARRRARAVRGARRTHGAYAGCRRARSGVACAPTRRAADVLCGREFVAERLWRVHACTRRGRSHAARRDETGRGRVVRAYGRCLCVEGQRSGLAHSPHCT
ncbi:urease accessory protein UreD [Paraburkholderia bengalensis]|uniref:Urease accessory protein UreD n=1 Tax=Paraburkholderia bengalensis TaxID=2747562 RepID=A0ABU8J2L2_9BURK